MTLIIQYNNFIDMCYEGSLWAAQILYVLCLVPQMITNYKKKCGKGISSILLIGYLNAFIILMFFIYLMDLPLSYKFMIPIEVSAVLVLIFQRLYYDNDPRSRKYWYAFALNLIVFVLIIPYSINHALFIGSLCGWINFVVSTFYQLPQVIKIHKEKSVEGFNFLFVAFNGIAAIIEVLASFLAYLPPQTCFSALRAIVISLIICGQFYCYAKRSQLKSNKLSKRSSPSDNSKLEPRLSHF